MGRHIATVALAALAALVALAPRAAAAQEPEPSREARAERLFREATPLVDAGRYAEACVMLEESEHLDPALGTEFNLAVCYERSGKVAAALRVFQQVASAAQAAGKTERARSARERASALEARLPPPAEPPRAQVEAPAPKPLAPTVPALDASRPWETRRWIGAGTFVAGVAGVVVGASLGGLALAKRSDLSAACPNYPTCAPERMATAHDLDDSGRSAALGSTIAFAAGGAALVVGAILFVTSASSGTSASSATSPATAGLRVVPTGRGAILEARW